MVKYDLLEQDFLDGKPIQIPNLFLEDSIGEMLEDIGEWSLEYIKEVLGDNCTFNATSL